VQSSNELSDLSSDVSEIYSSRDAALRIIHFVIKMLSISILGFQITLISLTPVSHMFRISRIVNLVVCLIYCLVCSPCFFTLKFKTIHNGRNPE